MIAISVSFCNFTTMKKSKRILGVLLSILVLHCSTLGYCEKITSPGTGQHDESILSLPSTHLFSYTTKHENTRAHLNSIDPFSAGNDGTFLSTIYKLAESILCDRISACLQLSKDHVLKLQSTYIVFPFHYFP